MKFALQINQNLRMKAKGNLSKGKGCYILNYAGTQSPMALYDWMYHAAQHNMYLKRKYQIGQFYKTIMHLPLLQRQIQYEKFKQSPFYQQLATCQVPACECPQIKTPNNDSINN